jgi:proline iminopeptidase
MQPNQILERADRLRGIPGVIVHGRYDVVCPVDQAYALHQAWPESRLSIIPAAGHSTSDPAMADALIRATDGFAEQLA